MYSISRPDSCISSQIPAAWRHNPHSDLLPARRLSPSLSPSPVVTRSRVPRQTTGLVISSHSRGDWGWSWPAGHSRIQPCQLRGRGSCPLHTWGLPDSRGPPDSCLLRSHRDFQHCRWSSRMCQAGQTRHLIPACQKLSINPHLRDITGNNVSFNVQSRYKSYLFRTANFILVTVLIVERVVELCVVLRVYREGSFRRNWV